MNFILMSIIVYITHIIYVSHNRNFHAPHDSKFIKFLYFKATVTYIFTKL